MATTEFEKGAPAGEVAPLPAQNQCKSCTVADASLRLLLLAASIVAVVVMVTGKQTENNIVSGMPFPVPITAKWTNSPAFIYFVVALSVCGLYSIITILASLSLVTKPSAPAKMLLMLAALDVVMLGIVASATGTAGGVAYIGLKGNKHTRWVKICGLYDNFCRHIGSSVAVALFGSVVLVFLIMNNACSLFRKIPPSQAC